MVAAVQCGADAIYLGAGDFNARKNANNFDGELESAIGYCHARNVKAYVTLNTMVRQDEIHRLEATIEEICRAGADGVIVQDFGTARAVRQMAPALPLHASTQMAAHNAQAVDFLVQQGFARVVLAREMDYDEIARCANRGAELEVFVHGALCVSCSGQCLMSSMIGGRSGNRGLCAQPCRMKYSMDGREGHLLSTKDLCGLDGLANLLQAGANSLKIEGRLKRPEYVAQTVSTYRHALDALQKGEAFDQAAAMADLKQMFNRGGFTRGYGFKLEDSELMYSPRPNHLGVEIGACRRTGEMDLYLPTDARDVLVLRRSDSEDIPLHPGALPTGRVSIAEARQGDHLVRLVSQAQMRAAQNSFDGEKKKFPIDMQLTLNPGAPAELIVQDDRFTAIHTGETVQTAQSRPADPQRIRAQMEKLGDTIFILRNYQAQIDANAFMPVSALNALRRAAVEKLFALRMGAPHACGALQTPQIQPTAKRMPELIAQSSQPEILQIALDAGADAVAYAPEDLRIRALNEHLDQLPDRFDLVLPPVMAQTTLDQINLWANAHGDRIRRTLLSNVGQLGMPWPGERTGDYPLNIANDLSIAQLADWEIPVYTPSIELNRAQISVLGGRRQLVVYGSVPLMHLRHCPLRAAGALPGKHCDCRRCDACAAGDRINAKAIVDRTGAAFPLRRIASDEGCVIQLRNSAKLMLLRKAASLPASEAWRMLLDESDPIEAIVALHRAAIEGQNPRDCDAWQWIEGMNTTTGHYFRGAE